MLATLAFSSALDVILIIIGVVIKAITPSSTNIATNSIKVNPFFI